MNKVLMSNQYIEKENLTDVGELLNLVNNFSYHF